MKNSDIYVRCVTFKSIGNNIFWDSPPKSWRLDGVWHGTDDVLDFIDMEIVETKHRIATLEMLRDTIRMNDRREARKVIP